MEAGKLTLDGIERAIRNAENTGDYLMAHELALRGVERYPGSETLKELAVRTLARADSPWHAETLYRTYGLDRSDNVDIASLEGRLAKDQYLVARSDVSLARRSAQIYEKVFERTGNYFPGINAATMWTLAGDSRRSIGLAREVSELCASARPTAKPQQYWISATQAEAALLTGDVAAARAHLRKARASAGKSYDALASTAKQLRLICAHNGIDSSLLDLLRIPAVIFFSGHIISPAGAPGRFPADREQAVAERIADTLRSARVRIGYGSLAAGADILFAEALLRRRAELHVVLPFEEAEFRRLSVAPSGGRWTKRFDACLARASSVTYATRGAHLGHDVLFGYAAKIAMGLARIRSRALEAPLKMIAVWDGEPALGDAGTAVDLGYWKAQNLDATIIDPGAVRNRRRRPAAPTPSSGPHREILPVLFGDIKGFSSLQEQHLPVFNAGVLTALAGTIHSYGKSVLFTNTWGDAVHVVFTDIVSAARCALAMQETLAGIDFRKLDLPGEVAMRISLHIGPVFIGHDPINREETYFGRTLTRAARMEPITPVGEVYVTEQFAALIEMERGDRVRCTYVGNVPLAKDFGNLRMYRLVRLPV